MAPYLGFAADLRRILDRMPPLAEEYGDEWKAAAALIPGMDTKVRDQLAIEHLVRCFRMEHGISEDSPVPARQVKKGPASGTTNKTSALLKEIGVTSGEVKAWAVYQGLLTQISRGQVSYDLVELYEIAHRDEEKAG